MNERRKNEAAARDSGVALNMPDAVLFILFIVSSSSSSRYGLYEHESQKRITPETRTKTRRRIKTREKSRPTTDRDMQKPWGGKLGVVDDGWCREQRTRAAQNFHGELADVVVGMGDEGTVDRAGVTRGEERTHRRDERVLCVLGCLFLFFFFFFFSSLKAT